MARFTLEPAAPAAAAPATAAPRFKLEDAQWSQLPGNVGPDAREVGAGFVHQVTHPIETLAGIGTVAQGGVDKLMDYVPYGEDVTNFLDRNLSPQQRERTPQEKEQARQAASDFAQGIYNDWGSLQKAKNTIITHPVRSALDILSVADPAVRTFRRIGTPFPASAEHLKQVNVLENAGVKLTAGQRTGSEGLKLAEDELGGPSAKYKQSQQGEQLTGGLLKKAGIDAERTTPEVIDKALNNFDTEYRGLASRNQIVPDQNLWNDLTTVLTNYNDNVGASQRVNKVNKLIQDIVDKSGPNNTTPISGEWYQSHRSEAEKLARIAGRAQGSDTAYHLQSAYHGIRQALDDAMDRSIVTNNPADAGAFRDLNNRYKNYLTIEDAATKSGAAEGILSPAAVRQSVVNRGGKRNYARGRGDYAQLARAGETLLPPPNSFTAPRLGARLGAGAVGSVIGHLLGIPGGEAAGLSMAAIGPELVGGALMSKPVQAYLGNQALNFGKLPARIRTGINVGSNVARTGSVLTAEDRQRRNRERLAKKMEQ